MSAFLALLLLQAAETGGDAELRRRVAALPPAVREVIERRAMCNHWGGEPPWDANRRRQIEQALSELRCETVHGEANFLRRYFASVRFAGSDEIVALLDLTADASGW